MSYSLCGSALIYPSKKAFNEAEACIQEANNPSAAFRKTVRMTHFEMQGVAAQMVSTDSSITCSIAEFDRSDVAEATTC